MSKSSLEFQLIAEEPFVKAPLEQVKKSIRHSQKLLENGTSHIVHGLEGLVDRPERSVFEIDRLLNDLHELKQNVRECKRSEAQLLEKSKARIKHLARLSDLHLTDDVGYREWSRVRLDRMLIDYMLRAGYHTTAQHLIDSKGLEAFADSELFSACARIESALIDSHSCAEALQWCVENRTVLRKLDIGLEFELRMQEYIELIRSNRKSDAISYCRKHMKPWKDRHLKEISRASTLLVFSPDTQCSPYKKLFSPSRWEELAAYFRSAVYRLYGLPSQPHLHLLLQTGLTALKCTDCYSDDPAFRNRDCPVCQRDAMGFLAEDLPLNQHANSLLVCGISGQKMDEDNPPMRLPNGNVYSYNALKEIMAANNAIVCPRTGEKYALADCQRLFIC